LIFYTPVSITNVLKKKWTDAIRTDFELDLTVVSRADIVSDLMAPANYGLCRSHLRLAVEVPTPEAEILGSAKDACKEIVDLWSKAPRLRNHFLIPLVLERVDADPEAPRENVSLDERTFLSIRFRRNYPSEGESSWKGRRVPVRVRL
jgi:hypothetical protein